MMKRRLFEGQQRNTVLAGSVAEKAGLLKGDEILSVNAKPYLPIASLRSHIGEDVVFKIRRKQMDEPFTILIQPVLVNPKQEMLEAQKSSVRIIERNKTRIGYIHIYSYAGYEYQQELLNALTWGKLKEADALIIDLRYGLGGAAPSYLNIFRRNRSRFPDTFLPGSADTFRAGIGSLRITKRYDYSTTGLYFFLFPLGIIAFPIPRFQLFLFFANPK